LQGQKNLITYVDIDPDLKQIAEELFLQKSINGKFIAQDARSYLQRADRHFDIIFSDVYSHQNSIPPGLVTKEYFTAIRYHLEDDGLMIANIIASPFFGDTYSQSIYNTIHSVFPFCSVMPLNFASRLTNIIYICPKMVSKKVIYTDNLNHATIDFFKIQEQK
jgi:spermidine synthase